MPQAFGSHSQSRPIFAEKSTVRLHFSRWQHADIAAQSQHRPNPPNPPPHSLVPHIPNAPSLTMPSPTYPSVDPYESASDSPSTSTNISPLPNRTNCEDNDYIEISDIEDLLLSDTAFYDLLAEAQTKLIKDGSLNHRHILVGVKGTYLATKINGKPSCTMEWQHCKNSLEAKDFITNAKVQHKLNGSPVLLEHFFNQQQCQESAEELVESESYDTEGNIVSCLVLVPDSDSDDETKTETDINNKEMDAPIRETEDACSAPTASPVPADPETILAANRCSQPFIPPPTEETANRALHKLAVILRPPCKDATGNRDPRLTVQTTAHMKQM